MYRIIITLVVLSVIGCKPADQFSLEGKTKGLKDGEMLTLLDIETREPLDSAKVVDNTFVFNTKGVNNPSQVVLHTKDYSEYRYLWLEDKKMTFDASKSSFRDAIVTGSELEKLSYDFSKSIDTLSRKDQQLAEQKFVKDNPGSLLSASILALYTPVWGKEKSTELYDLLSEENKSSNYGEKIERFIRLNVDPDIGDDYVDFEMDNVAGQPIKLSDTKGKLVLLEFWASWCGPCRAENPNLVKAYDEFNPKGFEIFAVSLDDKKDDWVEAIKKDKLTWTHASDLLGSDNEAALIYSVGGIPTNYLIDDSGKIVARNLRGNKLEEKLAELLN